MLVSELLSKMGNKNSGVKRLGGGTPKKVLLKLRVGREVSNNFSLAWG